VKFRLLRFFEIEPEVNSAIPQARNFSDEHHLLSSVPGQIDSPGSVYEEPREDLCRIPEGLPKGLRKKSQ
jgi:hypothetical protein